MNIKQHASAFLDRRRRFIRAIEGGLAIIPSASVASRSNDVEYVYRQDSDFYYLTGFVEPEAVAVFAPGQPAGEYILFVRSRDKEREIWTGRRAGVEGAQSEYGADRAYPIEELSRVLPSILEKFDRVYYPLGANEAMNQRVVEWVRQCQAKRPRSGIGPQAMLDPREIIHEMRLFKEEAELATMRRAAEISTAAHRAAMRETRGGMMEWAIEALVDYTFRVSGAAGPSYPSIVASGPNATVLHYITNDREVKKGDLILMDAGCEYQFYASDITRTYPANARFTPLQKSLYQAVLAAQLAAIEAVRPGIDLEDIHMIAVRMLVEHLRSLGLLKGNTDEIMQSGSYRRFYMHRTSHWLGMDVHDVGLYRKDGKPRALEPGMVITVEPGLYIGEDEAEVPPEFRGIGIRIEDDLLITPHGHEVLTAAAPKHPHEVEELTAS